MQDNVTFRLRPGHNIQFRGNQVRGFRQSEAEARDPLRSTSVLISLYPVPSFSASHPSPTVLLFQVRTLELYIVEELRVQP